MLKRMSMTLDGARELVKRGTVIKRYVHRHELGKGYCRREYEDELVAMAFGEKLYVVTIYYYPHTTARGTEDAKLVNYHAYYAAFDASERDLANTYWQQSVKKYNFVKEEQK